MEITPAVLLEPPPRPEPPPAPDPVVVVHGTFANPPKQDRPATYWWEPGGRFCRDLDAALQRGGLHARCWAGLENKPFSWTGENLEVARRAAARHLTQYLQALENDPAVRRYHVVAHSHGGQVARLALRSGLSWAKLGGVVYLGTPFLHFGAEPDRPGTAARINWFYVATAVVVALAAWRVSNWLLVGVAVALLKTIIDYFQENQPHRTFERAGVSLQLPNDEAVRLLKIAAPLLSDRKLRRRLVDSLAPARRDAVRYAAADYVPWISRQALDGWNRFQKAQNSGTTTSAPEAFAIYLAMIPTVLFWALVFLLKPFSYLLDWVRGGAIRVALGRGMKAAAALVFGINVRGLRFQPAATGTAPFGVHDYPIPAEVSGRVEADLAARDPAVLREVRGALAEASLDGLAGRMRDVFTRVDLLHAQYYTYPLLVEACARALQVDREVWRRLEERRLWARIRNTPAATGLLAERLARAAQESVETPELFRSESAAASHAP